MIDTLLAIEPAAEYHEREIQPDKYMKVSRIRLGENLSIGNPDIESVSGFIYLGS